MSSDAAQTPPPEPDERESEAIAPPLPEPRKRWSRRLWSVAVFTLLVVVGLVLTLVAAGSGELVARLDAALNSARVWMHGVQLIVIGVVWVCWVDIVEWLVRRGTVQAADAEALVRRRHRMMTMVLLFQLVVVMGLPLRAFGH